MNPLDELREMALRRSGIPADQTLSLNDIDAFAAAHPHLVDLSVCGPQCPACTNCMGELSCIVLSERVNETIDAPTGSPCPVMEGRK